MSFFDFLAGDKLQASRLMSNFRHFCGRGSDILPQDQNGNLLTDKSVNIGSITNQFGTVYCNKVEQSSDSAGIQAWGMINWSGQNMVTISSMTAFTYKSTYNGQTNCVIIDKTSHGVVLNDSITFSGLTGANSALNGTWQTIDVPNSNQFVIKIDSVPTGALSPSGVTCNKIHVLKKSSRIRGVSYTGGGLFRVYFNETITNYGVTVSGGGLVSNTARILTYGSPQSTYVDVGNYGVINSYSAIAVENCTCVIWA